MYCSKCGALVAQDATFCSTCGQLVPLTGAPGGGVMAGHSAPRITRAPPPVQYAGFWLRFAAYLLDSVVLSVVFVFVLFPVIVVTRLGAAVRLLDRRKSLDEAGILVLIGLVLAMVTVGLFVTWLYHALLESSSWQATLGKRALGLVVTDMQGQAISFARATGRHFAKIITNLIPFFIGYIMAGFTERRQALHDMVAGCLVLRKSPPFT